MSGRPSFNYPLFDSVGAELRGRGWDIVSPAEMDDEATRKEAMASTDGVLVGGTCNGETWGDFLARDVKLIADHVRGIILLPEWEQSKGARLECFVAVGCGHDLYEWRDHEVWPVSKAFVMEKIYESVV
jgi:hypothetical protein